MSGMTPLTESRSRHDGHPSQRKLAVHCLTGSATATVLDDIARLRARVLKAWPDLHDGDVSAERARLEPCALSWRSIAVVVMDGDQTAGAALGFPLEDDHGAMRQAFELAGRDATTAFLLAGSVLLPAYRGRQLAHRFFSERENHARSLGGFESTVFASVERDDNDPRRPPFGRGNEAFWKRRGYMRNEALILPPPAGPANAGFPAARQAAWTRPLERGY